jgi:hypothetical protein
MNTMQVSADQRRARNVCPDPEEDQVLTMEALSR